MPALSALPTPSSGPVLPNSLNLAGDTAWGNRLVSKTLGLVSGLRCLISWKDRTCQRSEEGQDHERKKRGGETMGKGDAGRRTPLLCCSLCLGPIRPPVYRKWRGTARPRRLSYMPFPESLFLGSAGNPGSRPPLPSSTHSQGLRIRVGGRRRGGMSPDPTSSLLWSSGSPTHGLR